MSDIKSRVRLPWSKWLPKNLMALFFIAIGFAVLGCDDDELTKTRERHLQEGQLAQSRQSELVAQASRELASGVSSLVAQDAEARRDLIAAHHELLLAQQKLAHRHEALDTDRKHFVELQRQDLIWAEALEAFSEFTVVALPSFIVGWLVYLAFKPRTGTSALDSMVLEQVLLQPRLLGIESDDRSNVPSSANRLASISEGSQHVHDAQLHWQMEHQDHLDSDSDGFSPPF